MRNKIKIITLLRKNIMISPNNKDDHVFKSNYNSKRGETHIKIFFF